MKIGILTFHWATNYGAVLQTYSLQTYLEGLGHTVYIINYKPRLYDDTLWSFLRLKKFLSYKTYMVDKKREEALVEFRKKYLNLTSRVFCCHGIPSVIEDLDIVISGSDQVLNPNFLRNGDSPRVLTPSYFLGFPFKGKKIGYAVSFGCTQYPLEDLEYASQQILNFDKVAVRENSGISILRAMGRVDGVVVPDPTSLLKYHQYQDLIVHSKFKALKSYIYCFFIRSANERKKQIKINNSIWNCDDNTYGLEDWLAKIFKADYVVTDSFHCVMMCLKLHKSFVVLSEWEGDAGMNDRLLTLLKRVRLSERLLHISKINEIDKVNSLEINWGTVDELIETSNISAIQYLKSIME